MQATVLQSIPTNLYHSNKIGLKSPLLVHSSTNSSEKVGGLGKRLSSPEFIQRPLYFARKHPTAGVTRVWAERGQTVKAEKTQSQKKAGKPRRLPHVGCTLCWAVFVAQDSFADKVHFDPRIKQCFFLNVFRQPDSESINFKSS